MLKPYDAFVLKFSPEILGNFKSSYKKFTTVENNIWRDKRTDYINLKNDLEKFNGKIAKRVQFSSNAIVINEEEDLLSFSTILKTISH